MYPVATMKELMAWATRFIRAKKDEARGRENFGLSQEDRPSKKDKGSSKREDRRRAPSLDRHRASTPDWHRAPSSDRHRAPSASGGGRKFRSEAATYKAVNAVFKEPIYKLLSKIKTQPFFKWPQPMRGGRSSRD